MIPGNEESGKRFGRWSVLVFFLAGCSPNLVERAIDARGGAIESYRKEVEADVEAGIPGQWSWALAYRAPDSFRWSLHTFGEEQILLFDGETARHQLGGALLPATSADDAVRSQAQWFAVTSLDVLRTEEVHWEEVPAGDLPPGVARGLRARFAGSQTSFELFFDRSTLLVGARGPVALAPIGAGLLDATFSDFRSVDGYRLPHRGEYRLDGVPLMRERVLDWKVNPPDLSPDIFAGAQ